MLPNPKDLHQALEGAVASARIEIRCTQAEKAYIQAVADHYGLTVTSYLLALHNESKKVLEG